MFHEVSLFFRGEPLNCLEFLKRPDRGLDRSDKSQVRPARFYEFTAVQAEDRDGRLRGLAAVDGVGSLATKSDMPRGRR